MMFDTQSAVRIYDFWDLLGAVTLTAVLTTVVLVFVLELLDRHRRVRRLERYVNWREKHLERTAGTILQYQQTLVRLRAQVRLAGGDPDAGEAGHGWWLQ